jgi:hypothetical protein
MEEITTKIADLEEQIEKLPVGYISKKMINGKERYYQQWTENGKVKSKYIRNEDFEDLRKLPSGIMKQPESTLIQQSAQISSIRSSVIRMEIISEICMTCMKKKN